MAEKTKENLDSLSTRIQRIRDELEVQANLGAAEARDEWEVLEKKLESFKAQADQVADAAVDAAEGVFEAASLAGDELLEGYERIKSLFKK